MRIALIASPLTESQHIKSKHWSKVIPKIHPLGLGYLGAYLEQYNYSVKIIDANSEDLSDEQILNILREFLPDVIGFSATTPAFLNAKRLIAKIRSEIKEVKVIIGGAHVTAVPEDTIRNCGADIGIIGEGEHTVLELMQYFEAKTGSQTYSDKIDLSEINGIVYKEGERVIITKHREFIKDIDSLPFPARHLMLPLKKLQPVPASFKYLPSTHLITSRGCSSQCTFCDRAIFGTKVRMASPKKVVDEIEEIVYKYGARDYKFFDDTFTANKKRVYEICDEIIKRKLDKIPWACLTKVRAVDLDILRYMKRAGCWQVLYGLESGDDRMLKLLKKGNSVEDNKRAVLWAHSVGLNVRGDFIVGTPGETMESMENTLNFSLNVPLGYAHFNKFVPLPGTELYRSLLEKRGGNDFYDYNKITSSITDIVTVDFTPDGLDKKKYEDFLKYAHKRFYLRPSYIFRRLLSISSFDQFMGQLHGAMAVFDL